jgi:hypothetical protein
MKTATTILALAMLILLTTSSANAQVTKQCVCHNVRNNPVEICTDDDSYKVGHGAHLDSGFDSFGTCPDTTVTPTPTENEPTPAVPEFGLLTGLATFAVSTGSYLMMKRKV